MYTITTQSGRAFDVALHYTDGCLRLVIMDHPRSAGWTAHALRESKELKVTMERPGRNPERTTRTIRDFTIVRHGRNPKGVVFVRAWDYYSPSAMATITP